MRRMGGKTDTTDGAEFHTVTKILLWQSIALLASKLNVCEDDFRDDPDPLTQFLFQGYLWWKENETRENRKQIIGTLILFVIKVARNDSFYRERLGGFICWIIDHGSEFRRYREFSPDNWYPKTNRIHYLVHDKRV